MNSCCHRQYVDKISRSMSKNITKYIIDMGKYGMQFITNVAWLQQLSVFGTNPNLPNIMTDNLPALQGATSSEILAKHLQALHESCEAFIQSEADERIR